ncbi:MAG: ArnT family glycosyltransferase [Deltaproteobacteria bacterium]
MAVPESLKETWWIGKMDLFSEVLCLLLILVPLAIAYRSIPAESSFAKGADEGHYMKYAQDFAQEGPASISRSLKLYFDTPELQRFPHPGRFGFTIITGLWLKAFPDTYRSFAHLSYAAMLLFLILSYVFSRRYLGCEVAALYTLLLACSPLLMAASRRVLQDSVLHLFWALPFWLFFEYLMTRRRWAFVGFCLTYIVALTIKEVSVFLTLFFVVAWLVFKRYYKKDLPWRDFAWVVLVPPLGAAVLYAVFLGGVGHLFELVDFLVEAHFTSASNAAFTSYSLFATGPWFKYLLDLLLVAPWVTILSVGFIFYLIGRRQMGPLHAYGLIFFVVLYALLSSMKFTKIIRFGMSLEIVTYLFCVLALLHLWRSRNRWGLVAVEGCILFFGFTQLQFYQKLFIEMQTYDIITVWMLLAHRIIPYFYMAP